MESPSSTVRRRAWINSSRQWPTLEDPNPKEPLSHLLSASITDDDVFADGCFTWKIEDWLQDCGLEAGSENTSQWSFESVLKANNFDDELSLGADASVLNVGEVTSNTGFTRLLSERRKRSSLTSSNPPQKLCLPSLNMGHSMTSSCLSSNSCKTTSSVAEVLQSMAEDAEETLYELGFGSEEPQVTARIPPRFFSFPSQAQGINFRLFLDSQLRRIREEDPSLCIASRFRQVQVLTAMANAFYSLYSHVSRTPLQKLASPECTFTSSPVERMERFRSSIRSEPRSPVERLKDTVSKMCLYAGSPRGSETTSPQPSPRKRSSLPDVEGIVLGKGMTEGTKKMDLGEIDTSKSAVDVKVVTDDDVPSDSGRQEKTQLPMVDSGNKICYKEMLGSKVKDKDEAGDNSIQPKDLDSETTLVSPLSGQTVTETDHRSQSELDSCSSQGDTRAANLKHFFKVTHDLICPQIVESVHQAPFCCQYAPNALPHIPSESIDESCPGSHLVHMQHGTQTAFSEPGNDSGSGGVASSGEVRQVDASSSFPVLAPNGSLTHYCITVSGGEGDQVTSCSSSEYSHTAPAPACEDSSSEGIGQYLSPLTHRALRHNSKNPQQCNSFELEEVLSAGEDDSGRSETARITTSLLSTNHQHRGEVTRGDSMQSDSMQSDSSGYADEEAGLPFLTN